MKAQIICMNSAGLHLLSCSYVMYFYYFTPCENSEVSIYPVCLSICIGLVYAAIMWIYICFNMNEVLLFVYYCLEIVSYVIPK